MRFRCYNCYLKHGRDPQGSEWPGPLEKCPRCGAIAPMITPLSDVHLLVPDAQGKVVTPVGLMRVACMPLRNKLAAGMNLSFTGDPVVVTCPNCLSTRAYREAVARRKSEPLPSHKTVDFVKRSDREPCC